jgi:hypothetical protein
MNYNFLQARCYQAGAHWQTAQSAQLYCTANDATLISIHNDEHVDYVHNVLRRYSYIGQMWIGLIYEEGIYSWLDDSPYDFALDIVPHPKYATENSPSCVYATLAEDQSLLLIHADCLSPKFLAAPMCVKGKILD